MALGMKVAIMLLHVGGGHIEASRNIERAILQKNPDAEVRIIDALACAPDWFEWALKKWWFTVQNDAQWMWGWMYQSKFFAGPFFAWWFYHFPWWGIRAALRDYDPDLVVTTHFVCGPIALELRKKEKLHYKVGFLLHEYIWHDVYFYWPGVDRYFLSTDEQKRELSARGVKDDMLVQAGIPIKEVFKENLTREEARRKLDIPVDKKVVFLPRVDHITHFLISLDGAM